MKLWIISDTHWNHDRIKTYCQRPDDFTERIILNWRAVIRPEDTVIHLGDVAIGNRRRVDDILAELPGKKILVRGNHDYQHSCSWWTDHGFDFVCDGLVTRGCWLTHKPATSLPDGCRLNIHGHLHNVWHGFKPDEGVPYTKLHNPWQRLFSLEYTDYRPVEFDKFVSHPLKYQATGINTKGTQCKDGLGLTSTAP